MKCWPHKVATQFSKRICGENQAAQYREILNSKIHTKAVQTQRFDTIVIDAGRCRSTWM